MKVFAILAMACAIGTSGCMSTTATSTPSLPHVDGQPVPLASGLGADPFPAFGVSVNAYRTPGLNPLVFNQQLQGAAQTHADNMSSNNFFSHTGSDGSSVGDRVTAQGYTWGMVGENIAQGQTTTGEALTGWQNSPGHNAILLHAAPTEFGFAWAPGNYWVMVVAAPL